MFGMLMIFVSRLRHEPHHVRPRVLFAEESRLEVGLRIVAAVVGVAVGALGRDDLHALRAGAARSCTSSS